MEKVKYMKENSLGNTYTIYGSESGVVFATGLFKGKAKKLVACWNEHDTLKAKAELLDEMVIIIEKYLRAVGVLSHSEMAQYATIIIALLSKAKELK